MSLSLNLCKFLRRNNIDSRLFHSTTLNCKNAASSLLTYDKDPSKHFMNADTQKLLTSITTLQFEKVFRRRTVPKNEVEYKFMTTKQIEDEVRAKFNAAQKLLQMPPIVKVLEEKPNSISNDPAINGFSTSPFVFTDITYGLKNSERSVIVRTPEGMLEDAPYSTRKRVFQIYFPLQGRKFRDPKMFEPENLERVLEHNNYEFLLDNLCLQYEPYEQQFHDITSQVYQHINEHEHFDMLRSTRHFGPMSFFLAWHKMIDNLLLDMIRNDYLKNGVELICLMFKLNSIDEKSNILKKLEPYEDPEKLVKMKIQEMLSTAPEDSIDRQIGKSSSDFIVDELCFEFIQNFVKEHSLRKSHLELALQTFKEKHTELKRLANSSEEARSMN